MWRSVSCRVTTNRRGPKLAHWPNALYYTLCVAGTAPLQMRAVQPACSLDDDGGAREEPREGLEPRELRRSSDWSDLKRTVSCGSSERGGASESGEPRRCDGHPREGVDSERTVERLAEATDSDVRRRSRDNPGWKTSTGVMRRILPLDDPTLSAPGRSAPVACGLPSDVPRGERRAESSTRSSRVRSNSPRKRELWAPVSSDDVFREGERGREGERARLVFRAGELGSSGWAVPRGEGPRRGGWPSNASAGLSLSEGWAPAYDSSSSSSSMIWSPKRTRRCIVSSCPPSFMLNHSHASNTTPTSKLVSISVCSST
mmetsp:Transcript_46360/g.136959  ORF Transcript_46360/g.136959 Transcript_46360/m.136959 type:complete len:316 (-) Transcript_46360:1764-2711(-)